MKSFDDRMKQLFSDMGIMVDPVVVKEDHEQEGFYVTSTDENLLVNSFCNFLQEIPA